MFVVSQKPKSKLKFIIKTVSSNINSTQKPQTNQININNTNTNLNNTQIPKLNSQFEKTQNPIQQNQQMIKKIFPKKNMFKLTFIRPSQNQNKHKIKNETISNNLKNKQKKNNISNIKYLSGRWKEDEHKRFIEAIIKYGNDWKQVQKYVKTRSSTQARSHAQKFFVKIKKAKVLDFNLDLSKTSIKMFHDMIKEASVEKYNKILNALNSIAFERNNKKNKKEEKNIIENNNHNINNCTNNNYLDISNNKNNEFDKEKDYINNNNNNLNESINNEIVNQINPNNDGSNIKYILHQLINNLADDRLDMIEGYQNLVSRKISIDSNYDNKSFMSKRRKRSSISSFKDINKGNNDEILNMHNPFGDYINGNNINLNNFDMNNFGNENKELISINNSRKVSQDDDYWVNYFKYGKKNHIA